MTARPTWSWQLLRAGSFKLDGGGMFGVVPKVIWSKMVQPDERNRIPLQTNCLLLEPLAPLPRGQGKMRILVETGYGEKWSDKERGNFDLENRTVVDALQECGVAPEQVDLVIVTHLHFDHAAALTRWDKSRQPISTFPNATIMVQRTEWADALANKSTMRKTYLRSHLDPVREQVQTVAGEAEVAPGVTVIPMPGHTWGQQAILFEDQEGVVCFPGDVMPTIHHAGPAYSLGYDMEPYINMLSKRSLLERAHREDWRLVLDHDPQTPVVRVSEHEEKPGQFALQPVASSRHGEWA